jgi:hypothetical protein
LGGSEIELESGVALDGELFVGAGRHRG